MITFHNADAVKWANKYKGELFHALFCDAPYHLTTITKRFGKPGAAPAKHGRDGAFGRVSKGFMGNDWDGGDLAFRPETWAAFGKVMYPGAFGASFAASRNWHRMAVAIEDAGFIIHPTIFLWAYASGFPKATRIPDDESEWLAAFGDVPAKVFSGHRYGLQALKPAVEPVIIFQKPYDGRPLDNILTTGAGTLNIDGARIGTDEIPSNRWTDSAHPFGGGAGNDYETVTSAGRWPANFILDQDAAERLDRQTGTLTSGEPMGNKRAAHTGYSGGWTQDLPLTGYGDSGGASRFFYTIQQALDESDPVYYCAKASQAERNAGLEDMESVLYAQSGGAQKSLKDGKKQYKKAGHGHIGLNVIREVKNPHPSVKPLDLCRYIASLLLPPLEYSPRRLFVPFSGVGSEAIGAHLAGWDDIHGVEFDKKNGYIQIAEARARFWCKPIPMDMFTGKTVTKI